ncbi:wHTH domain-containing protein [Streptomyces sp. NPDC054787]
MSEPFRALLIGVPYYKDPAIDDLPFIESDLSELARALRTTGYDVLVHDVQETDRDSIDLAVESFFQDAAPGQTLLLYLSGHGIHHDGTDFLVPGGAQTRTHDFPGKCLSLKLSGYVERSAAGNVVVFVDACREGLTLKEMGGVNAAPWSRMRVHAVGDRSYCHVYACSPGERARYATAGNSTFSLFSRALSTVVADEAGPSTLGELKDQLQSAVDALTAEHEVQRQQVRLSTETDIDGFVVLQRPERTAAETSGDHAWTVLAREHPVWKQVEHGPGIDALYEAALALVGRLALCSDKDERLLKADPWRPVGFAERMTDRVSWLLSKVINPEKLALSPAEAALLVIAPFLYTTYWNHAAARALVLEPENLARVADPWPERASYEQFFKGQSRLVRRAASAAGLGDAAGARGIAWWLLHRWLVRQPRDHRDGVLMDLITSETGPAAGATPPSAPCRLVAEVLQSERLLTLLRALHTSPDPGMHRPVRQLAGSTALEQHIREQLMVALLTVAHRLAIDPAMLPDVVVEHLGISYAVDLGDLHTTLETARWDARGRTRVLNAACRHPAVGLALRQSAASLDSLLGAIDVHSGSEPQLAPLQDLPAHATADLVHAAANSAGEPVYESTDLRFRLADDRIQELLMGEQLYGDPALAIRELYQNALDACRYRDARTRFLRIRQAAYPAGWEGRITFTQGVEDGRAYIECTDNGIGMGERDLREVFSHAGMRFADLPEYLEEEAAWKAEGIHLHPNSRFGIGVLSYFMIADDITVTTCRLDRDGHAGKRLQVDIAGPGALFYIRDLGRGHDAGTTVRLYLRSPDEAPSCTDLLRRLLWISDYCVTATDADTSLSWSPGVLSDVAPLGAPDPHDEEAARHESACVDPTSTPHVWWCSTQGGVLSDGVWAGIPLFGAVVNLTGRHTPQLTVDRRQSLSHDEAHVSALLYQEVPALLAEGARVLRHDWASKLMQKYPALADTIVGQAIEGRHRPWWVRGREVDVTAVGCFPQEAAFLGAGSSTWPAPADSPSILEHLADWRLLAWAKARMFPGVRVLAPDAVPVARPTDVILLSRSASRNHAGAESGFALDDDLDEDFRPGQRWLPPEDPVEVGHVLRTALATGRSPAEVAARLAELGHVLAEGAVLPATARHADIVLLSRSLDAKAPWLICDELVEAGHVLKAARVTGRSPAEVAAALAELGHHLREGATLPETARLHDTLLLSRDHRMASLERPLALHRPLEGGPPWLVAGEPVHLGHVLRAARSTGRPPAELAAQLAELGHHLPAGVPLPDGIHPDDARLLSRELDSRAPWLALDEPVRVGQVLRAARVTGRSPAEVAARLAELGHRLPGNAVFAEAAEHEDTLLVSNDLDGKGPWLAVDDPVELGHVLKAARVTGRSPAEVAARLVELGYHLPRSVVLPDVVQAEDTLLLSGDLDDMSPWLAADQPVDAGHVLSAARYTGRRPAEVAARLAELGYHLSPSVVFPEVIRSDDVLILSGDLDRDQPSLGPARPLSLGHVISAGIMTGRTPADIAARLAAFGLHLPDRTPLPEVVLRDDVLILSLSLRGSGPWLDADRPVYLSHILSAAATTKKLPADVAGRLAELGYELPAAVVFEPSGTG